MRKKIPDDQKRKKISISMDPRVYEMLVKYCKKYEIENYSEYFEKIIKEKLKS
jgi:metal-responsive CopG/Arc/MetJ family transcriptional regulator